MSTSAILGGKPVRRNAIPWTSTIGKEEIRAVVEVMESGILSDFLANSGDRFLGGTKVKELEHCFCERFNSKYAISVNSATTALHTAIAACGIGPGDEVLVPPYTMTATASAVLMNCALPVFVDIDENTYTIDPKQIERWITPRTKAIITVNLFGLPSNLLEIKRIAKKHSLYLIEDNAQAPGATINGKNAGTIGELGVFSLNYHKVIHSGEGGVILTDDEELARKCQLIRNHGEVALDELGDEDTVVLGSNLRMSELHAAIGIEQLKKLDTFLVSRRSLADMISKGLKNREGLKGVTIPDGFTHSYYVYPIKYNEDVWGINREVFAEAMRQEGFPLGEGYVKPIYLMNIYKHKRVYNNTTYPFAFINDPIQEYKEGICPVVERLHNRELLTADICRIPFTEGNINEFFDAIDKIWNDRKEIGEVYGRKV